ncbi:hypothetical protein EDD18DRAFT_1117355 [Armillaria luteobubalina]|uniref:Uncharacterized protein n=1 Tax=Armillaria luteobubalina TaxID=153913 RepID=A0AA39T9E3_9AGAR|nr:hypothetical protein EDD18DRAFT_1117355 [Armillaria luteobubalina]
MTMMGTCKWIQAYLLRTGIILLSFGMLQKVSRRAQSVMRLFNKILIEKKFIQPGTNVFKQKLYNEQVAKGETSTSAHAVSPDDLLKLYKFNCHPENWDNTQVSANNWCGANTCHLLEAIYLVVFTCLLHINKALKIQLHNLHFYDDPLDGTACNSAVLQEQPIQNHAEIPPFALRELPNDITHLCSVRALAELQKHF